MPEHDIRRFDVVELIRPAQEYDLLPVGSRCIVEQVDGRQIYGTWRFAKNDRSGDFNSVQGYVYAENLVKLEITDARLSNEVQVAKDVILGIAFDVLLNGYRSGNQEKISESILKAKEILQKGDAVKFLDEVRELKERNVKLEEDFKDANEYARRLAQKVESLEEKAGTLKKTAELIFRHPLEVAKSGSKKCLHCSGNGPDYRNHTPTCKWRKSIEPIVNELIGA